jgi:hypothetical protein
MYRFLRCLKRVFEKKLESLRKETPVLEAKLQQTPHFPVYEFVVRSIDPMLYKRNYFCIY